MTPEEKLEKVKELMQKEYDSNIHAADYDYEGGSMWEAYDTGLSHGKVELVKKVLYILNNDKNIK